MQTIAKRPYFRGRQATLPLPPRQSSGVAQIAGSLHKSLQMPSKIELCDAGEVAPGTALKVEKDGLSVAVFNLDGEFYVLDDLCTHGPGSLSEGYIEGDVVECNFHNGQFNIRTGEVVLPPCMIPAKTYPTTVENGKVVIEV